MKWQFIIDVKKESAFEIMHLKSLIEKQKADERRDTKGKCFFVQAAAF